MSLDTENKVVAMLREFIAVDSRSSENSVPVFDTVLNHLDGWHIETVDYQDAQGVPKRNAVARWPQSRSKVAFAGHLDTVPCTGWTRDPFTAAIEGDRLYGLGASDMKGPIAAFILAANALPPQARPTLVLTSDEEAGKQGVREVVARSTTLREQPPACFIVAEPTALGIVRGHRVDIAFTIHAQGVQAHSSTGRGVNANLALVPFLADMRTLHLQLRTNAAFFDSQYDPPYCDLNFVVDNYGTYPNMTVGLATCRIKFRYSKAFDPQWVVERICRSAEQHGLKMDIRREAPPPELPEDDPLVRRAEGILSVRAQVAGLGTEASEYSKLAPCLVFGPGDIEHAHKPTEYIDLNQLARSVDCYTRLATEILPA